MIVFLIVPALLLLSLLTLSRPSSALVLLTALLPTYLIQFSFFSLPTNLLEASIVTVFFFTFIQPSIRRQWPIIWRALPSFLHLLIALFVLSAIVSTIISPHILTSLGILKGWIIVPLLLGWLIISAQSFFPSSDSAPEPLRSPFAETKTLPAKTFSPNYYFLIIQSLVLSGNIVALLGLSQINHLARIKSVYDVPNSLALYLVPLLVISVWLFFNRHQRLFYLPSSLILAAALLATQSVAGISAAFISVSIGLILFQPTSTSTATRRPLYLRWGAVLTLVFISLGYLSSTGRLTYLLQPLSSSDTHNSLSVRQQLWSISVDLIKDHPLLGVGLGTFEPAYQNQLHERFTQFANCQLSTKKCESPLPEFVFRDPHNWLLSFWLNTGLLGLVSFILLNAYILVHAWRSVLKITGGHNQHSITPIQTNHFLITYQTQTLTLALLSILIFGLADTIYWKNDLAALHWTIVTCLIAQTFSHLLLTITKNQTSNHPSRKIHL